MLIGKRRLIVDLKAYEPVAAVPESGGNRGKGCTCIIIDRTVDWLAMQSFGFKLPADTAHCFFLISSYGSHLFRLAEKLA